MKKILIALVFLAGCSAQNALGPEEIESKIKQHDVTLQLVIDYIARLQELGMLPKPSEIKPAE